MIETRGKFLAPASKAIFIGVLCASVILAGCPTFASFTAAAEKDIPVVIQMVTNITNVIAPGVSLEIQTAGGIALTGLQLLCGSPAPGAQKCDPTSLVGQYQATPTTSLLAKIQSILADVNAHISQMLALAKGLAPSIGKAIVTAIAVALDVVTLLMSVLPLGTSKRTAAASSANLKDIPHPGTLKKRFNAAIGAQWPAAVVS